jgi:hemerythrin-like domain-containing protein
MNFVEKVMAHLQGGDESKVIKFQSAVKRSCDSQIREIELENIKLKERIEDAQGEIDEAMLNVDVSRIQTTDSRESYVWEYLELLESKEKKVAGYSKEVAANDKLLGLRKKQLKSVD